MTSQPDLAAVRDHIDAIDRQMVSLIAERQRWVVRAGSLKADETAVRAPARVEQVIRKVRALATDAGASPEVVEQTYRALIDAFISLELDTHRAGTAGGAGTSPETNPELALEQAVQRADDGRTDEAIGELSELLDTESDLAVRVRAGVLLGELLLASGRPESAEVALSDALTAATDSDDLDDVLVAELERARELLDGIR